jgi:hypothetical protein
MKNSALCFAKFYFIANLYRKNEKKSSYVKLDVEKRFQGHLSELKEKAM